MTVNSHDGNSKQGVRANRFTKEETMRQTDYILVETFNADSLNERVTQLLREDYQLHGNPIFDRGDSSKHIHNIYAQAMYRPFSDNRFD